MLNGYPQHDVVIIIQVEFSYQKMRAKWITPTGCCDNHTSRVFLSENGNVLNGYPQLDVVIIIQVEFSYQKMRAKWIPPTRCCDNHTSRVFLSENAC